MPQWFHGRIWRRVLETSFSHDYFYSLEEHEICNPNRVHNHKIKYKGRMMDRMAISHFITPKSHAWIYELQMISTLEEDKRNSLLNYLTIDLQKNESNWKVELCSGISRTMYTEHEKFDKNWSINYNTNLHYSWQYTIALQ